MNTTILPNWLHNAVKERSGSIVIKDTVEKLNAIHPSDLARLQVALDAPKAGPSRTIVDLNPGFPDTGFRVLQYRNNEIHRRFTVKADPKRLAKMLSV